MSNAFNLLERIKPKKRVAFLLRVVEGLSLEEVADIVEASVPTVAQRVRHASNRASGPARPPRREVGRMTEIEDLPSKAEGLEEVVRGVRAADDRLDEVARARMAAHLAEHVGRRLDTHAVDRAHWEGRRARIATNAFGWLLTAAAAALAAWLAVSHDLGRPPDRSASPTTAGNLDRVEVPAGAQVRARLGRADLTVIGPAEMEVTRVAESDLTLRLSSGILVGDYDGRTGGHLRIETPRLVATIVGTRFAIEATAEHARISVAHGRVAARDAARPDWEPETFVNAGETWEAGRSATISTPIAVARLLAAADNSDMASLVGNARSEATPAHDDPAITDAPRSGARKATPPAKDLGQAATVADTARTRASPALSVADSGGTLAVRAATKGAETPAPGVQPPPLAEPSLRSAPEPSPSELYRRAEESMSRRDDPAARRWLEEIIARYPRESEAESARFELARDALDRDEPIRANRWIDELIAEGRDRSLVASARFLKCRLARQVGEASEAQSCLERFRSEQPGSARDEEALALLIRLGEEHGACGDLRLLMAEHRRLYPGIVLPAGDRARCSP